MNRFCPISGTHARQIRLLLMAILTLSSSEATLKRRLTNRKR